MEKLLVLALLLLPLGVQAEEIASDEVINSEAVATEETSEVKEVAEVTEPEQANQVIEMEDNKINVIVMKQPLNEKSNQVVRLRRNWLGVYIQVNGKVKVNPLTNTYEVE